MNLSESFRIAIDSLRANKLRAFLTMLGIIIGIASVITLISVGRSVEMVVTGEFEGLGNNLLFVFPGGIDENERRQRPPSLTMDDYEALTDPFNTPDILYTAPDYSRPAIVTAGREDARTTVTGTTPEFTEIRQFFPDIGRFFNAQDVRSGARVAVIGNTIYEELFPDGDFPLDKDIKINDVNFRVIGVMEEKGGSGFNDQDNLILVPVTTAQRRLFPARQTNGTDRIDIIYVQAISEERQDAAIAQIEFTLRESRGISFRDQDDFSVVSQAEVVSAFSEVTSMLTLFLGVIAGISLLVGGIGIMNIMLVSVTERTREIGIRKAIGAKGRDILSQFLVESIMLAFLGGLIGLALGSLGSLIISLLSPDLQPTIAWESVVLAIGVSTLIGLFFGIYPASRAARLNPIDALRYE
ncbi:MAG TPA: ABC transporter permease [Anaerolineae bacterium]|nr:ABC transporter permease [Anaerolineae bacterium]